MIKQLVLVSVLSFVSFFAQAAESEEFVAKIAKSSTSSLVLQKELSSYMVHSNMDVESSDSAQLPETVKAVLGALLQEYKVGSNATVKFSFKKGAGVVFKKTF